MLSPLVLPCSFILVPKLFCYISISYGYFHDQKSLCVLTFSSLLFNDFCRLFYDYQLIIALFYLLRLLTDFSSTVLKDSLAFNHLKDLVLQNQIKNVLRYCSCDFLQSDCTSSIYCVNTFCYHLFKFVMLFELSGSILLYKLIILRFSVFRTKCVALGAGLQTIYLVTYLTWIQNEFLDLVFSERNL